jgi:arabinose-5-phosphate isomerase
VKESARAPSFFHDEPERGNRVPGTSRRDAARRGRALTGTQRIDLQFARRVLASEARAVAGLRSRVGPSFVRAASLLLALGRGTPGRTVTSGVGKAGIVAQKVCATLASTGTPALFMHPAEARHGDLGMLTPHDVLLAFSNSGESEELTQLLPALKKMRVAIIAITGRPSSTLGQAADVVLEIGALPEPCPLGLAPSASTTAMLALGDALALCVLKARGFTAQDYAQLHPGGALGRKLMRAADLMRRGERLPLVRPETAVGVALDRMSKARGGAAVVVDGRGRLLGVFTDGDFRRLMLHNPTHFHSPVREHMTSPCRFTRSETLVAEAQALMAEKHINALPIVDRRNRVVGILDIQDLVGWPTL